MGRFFFVLTLAAWAVAPRASVAQAVKDSGVKGTLVMSSVTAAVDSSAPITTTPAEGHFILTTFCSQFGYPLTGSTVGFIALGGGCNSFSPGIPLPPAEVLTCNNQGNGQPNGCSVTGVLSKK